MTTGSDIQVEKGNFTRIHNAILEKIITSHFTSREYSAILYLLRITYGYQTTEVKLSGTDWEQGTGIKRQNIMAVVSDLVERNIILQTGGGRGRGNVATYRFNKYFDMWGHKQNESPSMHLKMNPHQFILKPENESPSMQENESPSMQCTSSLKERKKVVAAAAAAATPDPYIESYQRIWALMPESEYRAQVIGEWAQRVTLQVWEYALKECADNSKVGQWRYLEAILKRLEHDGLPSLNGAVPPTKIIAPTVISVPR